MRQLRLLVVFAWLALVVIGHAIWNSSNSSAQSQTFTISGLITQGTTPGTGPGISGVNVQLVVGTASTNTSTDGSGNFSFANVASGSNFEVTPSKTGLTFQPVSQGGVLSQNRTLFFTGTPSSPSPTPTPTPTPTPANVIQFSTNSYSAQNACTTVTLTVNRTGDTSSAAAIDYATADQTASERSDYITALGTLRFAAAETSKTITILINADSFAKGPETFQVSLSNIAGATLGAPNVATVTITGTAPAPPANIVDDPRNYVCQQYHDFLNRQPDTSGWDFWTNQLNSCGTNSQCIDQTRVNVSAAFFLSIEFQQTGYLVERIYKAAFGDDTGTSTVGGNHQLPVPIVRYRQFLSDSQQIANGVVVLQPGWETVLENNKQTFAAQFVQRSQFTSALPTNMSPAQFVDKLYQNAGVTPSASDRNAAITQFGSATNTTDAGARARVLRQVAEDPTLTTNEVNRAFVLMQYLGYLRRNPNDSPDSDYSGYNFWLNKLVSFNGNYNDAEMVKAFLSSSEYRGRFGP